MAMKTDGIHYFNRCRRCNTLLTKLQIQHAFATDGVICTCGSGMFGPTNPVWYEWLLPRVVKMSAWQIMGWLAPAPSSDVPGIAPGPANFTPVQPLSAEEIRPPEEGEELFTRLTKN